MLLSFSRFVSQRTEPGPDQPDELYFKVSQLFDFIFFCWLAGLTGLFLDSAQLGARSVPTLVLFFFSLFIEETFHASLFPLGAAEVVLHLILMHYSVAILRHPRHDTNMCD